MHRRRLNRMTAIALAALLAVGCGGPGEGASQQARPLIFGPHDGPAAPLPGGGMFEVVIDAKGGRPKLAAYFYANDAMNAPLASTPTDVRIDLTKPGNESTSVPMTAGGGAGRFVSAAGDVAFDPMIGTLHATIGGETVSVPFSSAAH